MFGGMGRSHGRMGAASLGRPGNSTPGPTAPVLSLVSEVAGLVTLQWVIDDTVAAGDSLHRQAQISGGNWSSLLDDTTHVITSGEDTANTIAASLTFASNGTYDIRGFVIRASDSRVSASSNVLTITISDIVTGNHRISSTGNNRISSAGNVRKFA